MRLIILATLLISFLSCNSIYYFRAYQYSIVTEDNGEIACYRRLYEYSESYIGSLEESVRRDFSECLGLVGFRPSDYVKMNNELKKIKLDYHNYKVRNEN